MTSEQTNGTSPGDRYVVVSSDGHCGGDILEYKPYLASQWHDEFDNWVATYKSPFADTVSATAKRNWDSDFRQSEVDADGITGEILFPNTIPPFFTTVGILGIGLPKTEDEFKRRWAGLQAHNRWLVDFCSKEADRRRGLIQVFPNDVDAIVSEIRWASQHKVLGGVLLPAVPVNHEVAPWFHSRYEPIWQICEELDFPVCHHSGSGIPEYPWGEPGVMGIMQLESGLWTKRTVAHFIMGGIFERYPNLKFAMTEMGGLGWAAELATNMDFAVAQTKGNNRTMTLFADDTISKLSLTPTEYFQRNVYHGASVLAAHDIGYRYELGVDRIMWGTDYPHESCSTPESLEALRWTFADVPHEECVMMLGKSCADLFHFDFDALVATNIGPLVADVHQPLHGRELSAADLRLQANGTGDSSIRPFVGGKRLARLD
jgi:predicted TIM-barrel fold metal-dependent hydrolase